ncbi:MAG TPA: CaiB/BaiF CoA-transferase family protein, partial [Myxococcaceae bacterium]|nr:CaiB/BaiF CoA-transferase family protein [Myxococcaceae bacterium]
MLPLEGITIVSLEHAVAAPFCTRQLADYGARVIKIERPGDGDFARAYDQKVKGLASYFVWLNRGKESVTLDLKQPAAREALERLLARADVLVQNLAPGATQRMGLNFEALAPKYPRLVVADISGYGDTGPQGERKAYDLLIQAEAGLLSITGTPDTPSRCGLSISDVSAGMYAYTGVLLGLLERQRTGKGTRV